MAMIKGVTGGIVMTADVVGSTGTDSARLEAVLSETGKRIEEALAGGKKTFHFSRGDSFQAVIDHPADALRMAVLWRAGMIREGMDIRISLAVGEITHAGRTLALSSGPAFTASGRGLDQLKDKGESRMFLTGGKGLEDAYLQDTTTLADALISDWTAVQAEAIFELLFTGERQEALAKRLQVSQPAIHKRLAAARWSHISRWMDGCANLLSRLHGEYQS